MSSLNMAPPLLSVRSPTLYSMGPTRCNYHICSRRPSEKQGNDACLACRGTGAGGRESLAMREIASAPNGFLHGGSRPDSRAHVSSGPVVRSIEEDDDACHRLPAGEARRDGRAERTERRACGQSTGNNGKIATAIAVARADIDEDLPCCPWIPTRWLWWGEQTGRRSQQRDGYWTDEGGCRRDRDHDRARSAIFVGDSTYRYSKTTAARRAAASPSNARIEGGRLGGEEWRRRYPSRCVEFDSARRGAVCGGR